MLRHTQTILCILFLCLLPFAVIAQDQVNLEEIQKELDTKLKNLEVLEPMLLEDSIDDQTLSETRQNVKQIKAGIAEVLNLIKPLDILLKAEIADIGEVPTPESETKETDAIKELREKLNNELELVLGIQTQANALDSKSTRFLERLASIRRNQFVGKILENNTSPFDNDFWHEVIVDKDEVFSAVANNWESAFSQRPNSKQMFFISFGMASFVFFAIFLFSLRINTKNLRRKISALSGVSLTQRLAYSGYAIVFTFFSGAAGLLLVFLVIKEQGIINNQYEAFAHNIFLLSLFALFALTKSWTLFRSGSIRRTIALLSSSSVILFCVDFLLLQIGQQLNVPVELVVAQSFIVTTVFAVLILLFFFEVVRKKDQQKSFLVKRRFLYIGFLIGVFILLANTLGYVALTRFVFEQVVMLSNLVVAVIILRAIIKRALIRVEEFFHPKTQREDHLLLYWMALSVDAALLILSLPIIAAIIGVEWEGIRLLIYQTLSGIKVGGVTISLSSLATAVILFFVLMFATRTFQKILGKRVLTKTRMAESVRLSIVQVAGYIGLTIAFMSSVAAVGFDLSNLALIAGALSVGIGFGLQSVVSNFVSGLILLFERPIKVGDWVVLSSGEGTVKKISVRATEIETFDKASIIVPNAEFISSSVKNWTHKDRTMRIVITLGVSYNSDPQMVEDLLFELITSHEAVLKNPAPTVLFQDFGDSALIFDIRFYIKNVNDMPITASKIRQEIWKKLKQHNIEIPFPQRDLYIKNIEDLVTKIKEV
jgi:small-conductance mechanosensitive channel